MAEEGESDEISGGHLAENHLPLKKPLKPTEGAASADSWMCSDEVMCVS